VKLAVSCCNHELLCWVQRPENSESESDNAPCRLKAVLLGFGLEG